MILILNQAAVTAMTPQVQPPAHGQGQGYLDGQQQPVVDSATLSLIEQQNIAKKLLESDKRAVKQVGLVAPNRPLHVQVFGEIFVQMFQMFN